MLDIKPRLFLLVTLTVFLHASFLIAGTPRSKKKQSNGGLYQLVETRNGKRSCWGLIIRLGDLTFNKSIDENELTIRESKHQADLKSIMSWTVDDNGKKLTIEFKRGAGDFGTGDDATVIIRGSAFVSNPEQDYMFQISTDIL